MKTKARAFLMKRGRGRPRIHADRGKYLKEYMREFRKRQKAELEFLRGFYHQITEDLRNLGINLDKCDWWKPKP